LRQIACAAPRPSGPPDGFLAAAYAPAPSASILLATDCKSHIYLDLFHAAAQHKAPRQPLFQTAFFIGKSCIFLQKNNGCPMLRRSFAIDCNNFLFDE
jgi:hypothetical protein